MTIELILLILFFYGLICAFEGKITMFLRKLLEFFFPKIEDLSGELLVTGKDSINIKLKRCPKEIAVFFKDECTVVPCNPRHYDLVEWILHRDHCNHSRQNLTIKWDVTGLRSICWTVRY